MKYTPWAIYTSSSAIAQRPCDCYIYK